MSDEKTDEELYESCEDCHVANTVVVFAEIGRQCTGNADEIEALAKQELPPEQWLKELKRIKDNATCSRQTYENAFQELTDYLKSKNSPFLKALEPEQ